MSARLRLEYSGNRWDYEGDADKYGWHKEHGWTANAENFKPDTVEKAIAMLRDAMKDKIRGGKHGVTHAYWRLVYSPTGEASDEVVIAGPMRQGRDQHLVSPVAIREAIYGPPEPEPDPLAVLSQESVPTGTVVEILDEWGLPAGSTEVT